MRRFLRVSSLSEESLFLTAPLKKTMSTALDITKQAYEALVRRDIPAFLKPVADEVDWKLIGPASWPHARLRRNPTGGAAFFADLDLFDHLSLFEPRAFIEAGENVTVLGYLESFAARNEAKILQRVGTRVHRFQRCRRPQLAAHRSFPRAS
jgi:uncharacterized protein